MDPSVGARWSRTMLSYDTNVFGRTDSRTTSASQASRNGRRATEWSRRSSRSAPFRRVPSAATVSGAVGLGQGRLNSGGRMMVVTWLPGLASLPPVRGMDEHIHHSGSAEMQARMFGWDRGPGPGPTLRSSRLRHRRCRSDGARPGRRIPPATSRARHGSRPTRSGSAGARPAREIVSGRTCDAAVSVRVGRRTQP